MPSRSYFFQEWTRRAAPGAVRQGGAYSAAPGRPTELELTTSPSARLLGRLVADGWERYRYDCDRSWHHYGPLSVESAIGVLALATMEGEG